MARDDSRGGVGQREIRAGPGRGCCACARAAGRAATCGAARGRAGRGAAAAPPAGEQLQSR